MGPSTFCDMAQLSPRLPGPPLPTTETSALPTSQVVGAYELQARIKAARKKKAASQAPPVSARINPRQPLASPHRPSYPKASHGPPCIDAVIERLFQDDLVFANTPHAAHRRQHSRTTSSRSSMVARKSPLSTVSLPDGT